MTVKRIAHRGFSSEAPENSLAAFAMAVEGDFFGVECDIWKSRDGVYVVSHDGNLTRMYGVDRGIPDHIFSELKTYPMLRGRKRSQHPPQYLASFADYLSVLARVENCCPVIELKMNYTTAELEEIISSVKHYDLYERTFFISMYPAVLLRLKGELGFPADHLQYVYGATKETKYRPVSQQLEEWLIENRIHLDTRFNLLSKGNVLRLHKEGICINVWTVNKKEDFMRMVKDFGVDMVTTEYYFDL